MGSDERLYRVRVRPGRTVSDRANHGNKPHLAEAGEEVVLPLKAAAFFLWEGIVEIIAVVEAPEEAAATLSASSSPD